MSSSIVKPPTPSIDTAQLDVKLDQEFQRAFQLEMGNIGAQQQPNSQPLAIEGRTPGDMLRNSLSKLLQFEQNFNAAKDNLASASQNRIDEFKSKLTSLQTPNAPSSASGSAPLRSEPTGDARGSATSQSQFAAASPYSQPAIPSRNPFTPGDPLASAQMTADMLRRSTETQLELTLSQLEFDKKAMDYNNQHAKLAILSQAFFGLEKLVGNLYNTLAKTQ